MTTDSRKGRDEAKPAYVTPAVKTMSEDQVLDEVGPAHAYTGNLPFGF